MGFADLLLSKRKTSSERFEYDIPPGGIPNALAGTDTKVHDKLSEENQILSTPSDQTEGVKRALRFTSKTPVDAKAKIKAAVRGVFEVIEHTILTIDSLHALLFEVQELTQSVKQTQAHLSRLAVVSQYNDLLDRIPTVLETATHNGTNLINGSGQRISVPILEAGTAQFVISHTDLSNSEKGLDLPRMDGDLTDDADVMVFLTKLDQAIELLERTADAYCQNAEVLSHHFDS